MRYRLLFFKNNLSEYEARHVGLLCLIHTLNKQTQGTRRESNMQIDKIMPGRNLKCAAAPARCRLHLSQRLLLYC